MKNRERREADRASVDPQPQEQTESAAKPEGGSPGSEVRRSDDPAKGIRRVDPMILWGAWPGDEPIEELLAELD